jgi:two-component system, OmpR family, sensor histidine kinase QseC
MNGVASQAAALPSVRRRVVLTVLVAFVAVYALLMVVITYNAVKPDSGEIDKLVVVGARGIALGLDQVPTAVEASALINAMRVMDQHLTEQTTENNYLRTIYVAVRLDGSLTSVPPEAPVLDYLRLSKGVSDHQWKGENYRAAVADGTYWRVVVLDKLSERSPMMLRSLSTELALYLGMAVPVVLLPVWLAVRAALKPLQQLSSAVAQRQPGDLKPLVVAKPYRELAPLVDALNHLFERVAAGISREKGFVHDAAHELRTPLAVISAQAHVLAHSTGADHTSAQQHMKAAVARASHLTQQLLRLAQADASAAPAAQATLPLDVMNLLRDVVAAFETQAQSRAAEVELLGPDSLPWQVPSAGHEHLLRSVIENLVDNALRYGGWGCKLEVSVALGPEHLRISVADSGPGIPADQHARVFERFWRGNHSAETGAGLGLAIVQEAVKAFAGTVHIGSGLQGRGCAMVVQLPAQRVLTS